tara:strand:- start:1559 stop:2254 length:696 start_codon:yes stop_codon:yes gene_type:complete
MRKFLTTLFLVMGFSAAHANDIYIQQIGTGNGLDLSITQDGVNNVMGTSSAKVILSGANHTWTVSQVGGANVIAAQIRGNTYTGTWAITGNSNNILFKCASAASSKCETATGNITINGNTSDIDILIGESADSATATLNLTIDGDANVFNADIDGKSAIVTVSLDNQLSAGSDKVTMNLTMDGDGDTNGHTVILDHTGDGTIDITQSGVNDAIVSIIASGTGHDIDIVQSD